MKRIPLTHSIRTSLFLTLLAAMVLGVAGCASDGDEAEPAPPPDTGSEFSDAGATAPEREEVEEEVVTEVVEFSADPVYFAFDSAELSSDATRELKGVADVLSASGISVVLSGHCDARGSEEYNLALGERRAAGVRRYLGNLGVPIRQMKIVSYGEIRPAARGNTEEAWALNRRVEFEVSE